MHVGQGFSPAQRRNPSASGGGLPYENKTETLSRLAQKPLYSPFYVVYLDPGLGAVSERPFIHDSNHGKRVCVLNPARQVPLARDRYHRVGPVLEKISPRHRASRKDKEIQPKPRG